MKKILILLTCFMFSMVFSGSVSAQPTVAWAVSYDGVDDDRAQGVAVDSNDNVIVTGYSSYDYNTIKYDSNGNLLWEVRYDSGSSDLAFGVAVDSNDNVIVTGYSRLGEDNDYYTIKYDSNGNELWAKRYDSGFRDMARGVAVDSNDNVIVTGIFYSYLSDNVDYNTIKYDSNGNLLWEVRYDSGGYGYQNDDSVRGVAVDSNDNVIVTGSSKKNYYTIKYDSNGNQLWAKSYGEEEYHDVANGVAVDSNDNVVVTGASSGNYYTIKYGSNGNLFWAKSYDSGGNKYNRGAHGVAVDSYGNVVVTGSSSSNYNTIKYGSNGNLLWTVSYDGGYGDTAYGVAVDSSNNVIVTGYSYLGENVDYYTIKYISEVLLNDTISAELHPSKIGDYDNDGIPDLMVKFDRVDVADLIKALNLDLPADVELTVTGSLIDGTQFSGSDTIRVIDRCRR